MGVARSTYYAEPAAETANAGIIAEMRTICDEFEAYGYRRVDAELCHRGYVVNSKKVCRVRRENDSTDRFPILLTVRARPQSAPRAPFRQDHRQQP